MTRKRKCIAVLGGGPSALFTCKRLIESGSLNFDITVFEKKDRLGAGMPYSSAGANVEHVTNVSPNEIPTIVTPVSEWIHTVPQEMLDVFNIDIDHFNEYKVLPRLFFGAYLESQFKLLLEKAESIGIGVDVRLQAFVSDIKINEENEEVSIVLKDQSVFKFDAVVICTGHLWPIKYEGKVKGYFDSPYPPRKLEIDVNHPVAIKGSSLTAIDAIRTLARQNGEFSRSENGFVTYARSADSPEFKIVMHSRNGMLPAVRIHLDDSHLNHDSLLTEEELAAHKLQNGGFISLDFIFEYDFKTQIREKDPKFYAQIKDLSIEDFVDKMMAQREKRSAFELLKIEYDEAERSIAEEKPIYWKEMLAVLSFSLNQPAKYLSAEDMLRLKHTLMPLISVIIAFVPQSSCKELFALHDAGVLDLIEVGDDGKVEIKEEGGISYTYINDAGETIETAYQIFVDCVGQPHLSFEDFPFKSLIEQAAVSPAKLRFKNSENGGEELAKGNDDVEENQNGYFLKVPGIAIDDNFEIVGRDGLPRKQVTVMAVPHIGGFNPDYSGLDFCEAASLKVAARLLEN